jgi:hypothetical protein
LSQSLFDLGSGQAAWPQGIAQFSTYFDPPNSVNLLSGAFSWPCGSIVANVQPWERSLALMKDGEKGRKWVLI